MMKMEAAGIILPEIDIQIILMMKLDTIISVFHLNKSLYQMIYQNIVPIIENGDLDSLIKFIRTLFRMKEFALVEKILQEDRIHHIYNKLNCKPECNQEVIKLFLKDEDKTLDELIKEYNNYLYTKLFIGATNDQELLEIYLQMAPANYQWKELDNMIDPAFLTTPNQIIFLDTLFRAAINTKNDFFLRYMIWFLPFYKGNMIKSPYYYNQPKDLEFLQTYDEKFLPLLNQAKLIFG